MANEVRSQRLMQFLQVSSNYAPFAKFQYIIREIAKSLDLDPDKVTNNMNDAAIQAELMKQFQQEQQAEQGARRGSNGYVRSRWWKYRHGSSTNTARTRI